MAKRTTTVFDAWLALFDLLDFQSWPAHPVTGEIPLRYLGDTRDLVDEGIWVPGLPPDQPAPEWKTMGSPSQDETYTLRVVIGSKVFGTERREALLRIKELVAVVESALRDQTTGRPAGGFVATVGGVQYMDWQVARIAPALGPALEGDSAYVEIDIAFKARI